MGTVLRAASGQHIEVTRVTGPTSYPSGDGFSVTSDMGRVDEFTVQSPSDSVLSKNDNITGNNTMVVKAYSMTSNVNNEIEDAVDLSGDDYILTAYRL